MKLSIWNQFSSNHSADFTTVAQFESEEWAQTVAEEIRQIIAAIYWWQQHINTSDHLAVKFPRLLFEHQDTVPLLLRETAFLQFALAQCDRPELVCELYFQDRYEAPTWRKPLDWLMENSSEQDVQTFDHFVVVSNTASTWAGSQPFHTILERLGGWVASSLEGEVFLAINLQCEMPTSDAAQTLIDAMQHENPPYIRIAGIPDSYGRKKPILEVQGTTIVMQDYRPNHYDCTNNQSFSLRQIVVLIIRFFETHGATNIDYYFSETQS